MIKINGTKIKTPKDFSIERYNLTKSGRVASGLMVMEFVAKKVRLELSYDIISGDDLNLIYSLIDSDKMFFDVTYPDLDGTIRTKTCYAGALPSKLKRGSSTDPNNGWYWESVSFSLIER